MDVATLFASLFTQVNDAIADLVPLAIPITVSLALIGIVFVVIRKFGVKTR